MDLATRLLNIFTTVNNRILRCQYRHYRTVISILNWYDMFICLVYFGEHNVVSVIKSDTYVNVRINYPRRIKHFRGHSIIYSFIKLWYLKQNERKNRTSLQMHLNKILSSWVKKNRFSAMCFIKCNTNVS